MEEKRKRQLSSDIDYTKCLICQSENRTGEPLNRLTELGYANFKHAVEVRKDEIYNRLWEDIKNEEKFLSKPALLHRNCRSNYTHKHYVEKIDTAKFSREEPKTSDKSSKSYVRMKPSSNRQPKCCNPLKKPNHSAIGDMRRITPKVAEIWKPLLRLGHYICGCCRAQLYKNRKDSTLSSAIREPVKRKKESNDNTVACKSHVRMKPSSKKKLKCCNPFKKSNHNALGQMRRISPKVAEIWKPLLPAGHYICRNCRTQLYKNRKDSTLREPVKRKKKSNDDTVSCKSSVGVKPSSDRQPKCCNPFNKSNDCATSDLRRISPYVAEVWKPLLPVGHYVCGFCRRQLYMTRKNPTNSSAIREPVKRNKETNDETVSCSSMNNPTLCLFCDVGNVNEVELGTWHQSGDVAVHYYCLLFSSGLPQNGEDEEGILGFLLPDMEKERSRGSKLKCVYCCKKGATIGCSEKTCRRSYHYICGLRHHSLFKFSGDFESYCSKHRDFQTGRGLDKKLECPVCMEELVADPKTAVWAPCCKRESWFHRLCMQKLALSAGYFFKCPFCNDNDVFVKEMQNVGIYVPEKDASWELVPNAFSELERPVRCDAGKCKCPDGRKRDDVGTRWEVIFCELCGSTGIHISCGNLSFTSSEWTCSICKSMLTYSLKRMKEEERIRRVKKREEALLEDNNQTQEENNKVVGELESIASCSTLVSETSPRGVKREVIEKLASVADYNDKDSFNGVSEDSYCTPEKSKHLKIENPSEGTPELSKQDLTKTISKLTYASDSDEEIDVELGEYQVPPHVVLRELEENGEELSKKLNTLRDFAVRAQERMHELRLTEVEMVKIAKDSSQECLVDRATLIKFFRYNLPLDKMLYMVRVVRAVFSLREAVVTATCSAAKKIHKPWEKKKRRYRKQKGMADITVTLSKAALSKTLTLNGETSSPAIHDAYKDNDCNIDSNSEEQSEAANGRNLDSNGEEQSEVANGKKQSEAANGEEQSEAANGEEQSEAANVEEQSEAANGMNIDSNGEEQSEAANGLNIDSNGEEQSEAANYMNIDSNGEEQSEVASDSINHLANLNTTPKCSSWEKDFLASKRISSIMEDWQSPTDSPSSDLRLNLSMTPNTMTPSFLRNVSSMKCETTTGSVRNNCIVDKENSHEEIVPSISTSPKKPLEEITTPFKENIMILTDETDAPNCSSSTPMNGEIGKELKIKCETTPSGSPIIRRKRGRPLGSKSKKKLIMPLGSSDKMPKLFQKFDENNSSKKRKMLDDSSEDSLQVQKRRRLSMNLNDSKYIQKSIMSYFVKSAEKAQDKFDESL